MFFHALTPTAERASKRTDADPRARVLRGAESVTSPLSGEPEPDTETCDTVGGVLSISRLRTGIEANVSPASFAGTTRKS